MKAFEKYMYFIAILGQMLHFVQAYKVFSTQNVQGVSLMAFWLGLIAGASWLIYGILLKNWVVIVSNILAVLGASLVITGILIYRISDATGYYIIF